MGFKWMTIAYSRSKYSLTGDILVVFLSSGKVLGRVLQFKEEGQHLIWVMIWLFNITTANGKVESQEISIKTGKFGLESDMTEWLMLSLCGLGVQDEAGQGLTEFCQGNTLVIANILFQQTKRRLYTWTSPDGQYRNQIDYVLCSLRWRTAIQSAKTRPRADYGSDHQLLIAKFKLKLKKGGKPLGHSGVT